MKSSSFSRWMWIAAVAAALLLRIFLAVTTNPAVGDSGIYEELAKNWRSSRIYGLVLDQETPTPVDIRVPGYPAFLAVVSEIFRDGVRAQILAQAAVDVATCFLAALLAGWLAPPERRKRAMLVAMWLAALCPFIANYSAVILAEVLATFWTALALVLLAGACAGSEYVTWGRAADVAPANDVPRNRIVAFISNRWFLGGLAAGCGTLVRPETPLLLNALALLLIWRWRRPADWRKLARAGALTAVGMVLPLIPWTARNAITLHEFQPLAARYAQLPDEYVPRGFMAWTGTWMVRFRDVNLTPWNLGVNPLNISDLPASAFDSEQERERVKALYDEYDSHCCNYSPAWDAQFAVLAHERTARHPLRTYFTVPFERAFTMWLTPRMELSYYSGQFWPPLAQFRDDPANFGVTVLFGAIGIFYSALALVGVWRAFALRAIWRAPQLWAIAFLVIYCVMRTAYFTQIDTVEPRYVLECFPAVFALGAIFFASPKKTA